MLPWWGNGEYRSSCIEVSASVPAPGRSSAAGALCLCRRADRSSAAGAKRGGIGWNRRQSPRIGVILGTSAQNGGDRRGWFHFPFAPSETTKSRPRARFRSKRLKGFEPSTFCMASRRSSQLSYSRTGGSLPGALGSGAWAFKRQARRLPALDAVDHVADVEAEAQEGGGCEDGLVALVADQDDAAVGAGEGGVAVVALGIEAPLEDVAVDDGGARD